MWCFNINNGIIRRGVLTGGLQAGLAAAFMFAAAAGVWAKGSADSETAKAYFEIAQAYTDVSKYDKAAEFYLKAMKDPAHKNASEYNLARVYGLQGDWAKARPILERQYQEAPGNLLILKAYAYSLAATGDDERACAMYKKLADEDTENPDAAINYARILVLAKRYDEADALITELKERFVETAEKKQLDEIEEKIKKAREPPEKTEDEDTDDDSADTGTSKDPDRKSDTEKSESLDGKDSAGEAAPPKGQNGRDADQKQKTDADTVSAGAGNRTAPDKTETAGSKKAAAEIKTEKVKNGTKT